MINVKKEFRKSPGFYWALHPGISNVFTTVDPRIHGRYRRLLSAAISESGLKQFYPRVEQKSRAVIAAMDDEMQQRGAVDVLKWWHMMTFDSLTDLAFGEPVGALQHGEVCFASFPRFYSSSKIKAILTKRPLMETEPDSPRH